MELVYSTSPSVPRAARAHGLACDVPWRSVRVTGS